MLHDAALEVGIPVVHGSIFRFEGQVTVFKPHDGPCYRCFLPEPPPVELAPSFVRRGRGAGRAPGIIGSIPRSRSSSILGPSRAVATAAMASPASPMAASHDRRVRRNRAVAGAAGSV